MVISSDFFLQFFETVDWATTTNCLGDDHKYPVPLIPKCSHCSVLKEKIKN